jgi:hypothetical protein
MFPALNLPDLDALDPAALKAMILAQQDQYRAQQDHFKAQRWLGKTEHKGRWRISSDLA